MDVLGNEELGLLVPLVRTIPRLRVLDVLRGDVVLRVHQLHRLLLIILLVVQRCMLFFWLLLLCSRRRVHFLSFSYFNQEF